MPGRDPTATRQLCAGTQPTQCGPDTHWFSGRIPVPAWNLFLHRKCTWARRIASAHKPPPDEQDHEALAYRLATALYGDPSRYVCCINLLVGMRPGAVIGFSGWDFIPGQRFRLKRLPSRLPGASFMGTR